MSHAALSHKYLDQMGPTKQAVPSIIPRAVPPAALPEWKINKQKEAEAARVKRETVTIPPQIAVTGTSRPAIQEPTPEERKAEMNRNITAAAQTARLPSTEDTARRAASEARAQRTAQRWEGKRRESLTTSKTT